MKILILCLIFIGCFDNAKPSPTIERPVGHLNKCVFATTHLGQGYSSHTEVIKIVLGKSVTCFCQGHLQIVSLPNCDLFRECEKETKKVNK